MAKYSVIGYFFTNIQIINVITACGTDKFTCSEKNCAIRSCEPEQTFFYDGCCASADSNLTGTQIVTKMNVGFTMFIPIIAILFTGI